jgi:HAMP domain-containing protein
MERIQKKQETEPKFRIRTKMLLAFLGLSLTSLVLFGYVALSNIRRVGDYALESSTSLGESATNDSTHALEALGARMIKQKAEDVAMQCAIYMNAHPDMTIADLQASSEFQEIAVQPVGETGYTCLYEKETGNMRFHPNPKLIDFDLHNWREKLPSWWEIFEPSLDGSTVGGYYDWEDADGEIRQKFMYMVPVEGTMYMVAATTYIDEFSKPVEDTKEKIAAATLNVNEHIRGEINYTRNTFIGILIAMILIVSGVSFVLSKAITDPIMALRKAAQSVERGERFEPARIADLTRAQDELADLARVFTRMAVEVQAREQRLEEQVRELRIEIDQVKKTRQVAEITETKYFQHLQEHAKEMREKAKGE